MRIKDISKENRPRERFLKAGAGYPLVRRTHQGRSELSEWQVDYMC